MSTFHSHTKTSTQFCSHVQWHLNLCKWIQSFPIHALTLHTYISRASDKLFLSACKRMLPTSWKQQTSFLFFSMYFSTSFSIQISDLFSPFLEPFCSSPALYLLFSSSSHLRLTFLGTLNIFFPYKWCNHLHLIKMDTRNKSIKQVVQFTCFIDGQSTMTYWLI